MCAQTVTTNRILLTGAGFSKNWGGWLADELTGHLLGKVNDTTNSTLVDVFYEGITGNEGNCESVLQKLQVLYESEPLKYEGALRYLEDAIRECFREMDAIYTGPPITMGGEAHHRVANFLGHFDAIFTTNQDGLIEARFWELMPLEFSRTDRRYRNGLCLPGIIGTPTVYATPNPNRPSIYTVPDDPCDFRIVPKQNVPYVKLHGSWNWRTPELGHLMISGGNKKDQIAKSPLLKSYLEYFSQEIQKPNTHLVVIGYGFGDVHINSATVAAATTGARVSVIDPQGFKVTEGKRFSFDSSVPEARAPDVFWALRGSFSELSRRPLTDLMSDAGQAKILFRDALGVVAM